VKDTQYLQETTNKIIKTREVVKKQLQDIGFTVLDSKTNFLFVIHERKKAIDIFESLRKNKILVRYFNKPRIDNGLRITIGTDKQMEELVKIMQKIVKE